MTATMNGDPYRLMFDIRDGRRPLPPHQLVGVSESELNRETIIAALEKRRGELRVRRNDVPLPIWQRISKELEEAAKEVLRPLEANGAAGSGDAVLGGGAATAGVIECTCGAANPGNRKFCSSCGSKLHNPCPACGETTTVGEAFCGGCGADLNKLVDTKREAALQRLNEAKQFVKNAQFSKALVLLKEVAASNDSRLTELATRAKQMIDEVVKLREAEQARADQAISKAKECIEEKDFEKAVRYIHKVVEPLRTEQHAELLTEANEKLQEITLLRKEVKRGLKEKQYSYLLAKLQTLRQLVPGDDSLPELIEKVTARAARGDQETADRVIRRAKLQIQQFDYALACEVLEEAPPSCRGEEWTKLTRYANEAAYLYQTIKSSPWIDDYLKNVIARLAKLAPKDERAAKVSDEFKKRLADKKGTARIRWSKPSEHPPLGCAVEGLDEFGRIDAAKQLSQSTFHQHASELFVACGLALAGLGLADVDTNLVKHEEAGFRDRLGGFLKRRGPVKAAWGVDLGPSALKAVRLVNDDGKVRIDAFDHIPHSTRPTLITNEEAQQQLWLDTLEVFRGRNELAGEPVVSGYGGQKVLTRFFTLPSVDEKRLPELMKLEVRQQMPMTPDDLSWSYHVWPHPPSADIPLDTAILVASKATRVDLQKNLFVDAEIPLQGIVADNIALHNFLRFAHQSDAIEAIVDLGAETTNVVVSGPRLCWCRTLVSGADSFTNALVRKYQKSFPAAEQMARDLGQFKSLAELNQIWQPVFDQITRDLASSMNAFRQAQEEDEISRIWLAGGGAQTPGMNAQILT